MQPGPGRGPRLHPPNLPFQFSEHLCVGVGETPHFLTLLTLGSCRASSLQPCTAGPCSRDNGEQESGGHRGFMSAVPRVLFMEISVHARSWDLHPTHLVVLMVPSALRDLHPQSVRATSWYCLSQPQANACTHLCVTQCHPFKIREPVSIACLCVPMVLSS